MIFRADLPIVRRAETIAGTGDTNQTLDVLRQLTPMDFGRLHLDMPHPAFPNLSRLLPRMAPVDVQTGWTGSHGYNLFRSTYDFTNRLRLHFEAAGRRSLRGASILDYGCGWGRLARMMSYYSNPEQFFGVDPLQESIDICKRDGILGNLALSDYLPESLPVGEAKFDLMYAYSVFTHTSKRATLTALSTLRKYIKPDGILVITVRPVEIWDLSSFGESADFDRDSLVDEFERTGFAFLPNRHFITDGDHTYGVTTMSPKWLGENAREWRLVVGDRGEDHLQYILVLKPA